MFDVTKKEKKVRANRICWIVRKTLLPERRQIREGQVEPRAMYIQGSGSLPDPILLPQGQHMAKNSIRGSSVPCFDILQQFCIIRITQERDKILKIWRTKKCRPMHLYAIQRVLIKTTVLGLVFTISRINTSPKSTDLQKDNTI